ncbi:HigA family addiction module antitoxin [Achromobacter sp. UMC46]|uniref:HigA family addiction module antitoxin n=1 Tax=Achromobacter sp. UMC46 TaxID=1862319 RepID=UPI0016026909|nr:HigA family addiction module antitoxin [Achromobacter sp. UMC46]
MTDFSPSHPGETLRKMVFESLSLSVSEVAERLCMSRPALSRVLNCRAGISPDLAIRLEKAGVRTARFWMSLQLDYDLWRAMKNDQPTVKVIGSGKVPSGMAKA